MKKYSREFLRAIPKSDLHVHLDGSLRLKTLIELAKETGVKLPSYTEEGLEKTVFKKRYKDLVEYLKGFQYTAAVMQTPEGLQRVAYEFAIDNFEEGVRYVEPRFAPHRHASSKLSPEDVIVNVNIGLEKAKKEINSNKKIKSGEEPSFEYAIICCALRMFTSDYSGYYSRYMEIHPNMPDDELFGLAAEDLVRAMIKVRDENGVPVAGMDLAGAEDGYPAEHYKLAYDLAHKHFFKKTVHAGEAYGPESIFQAITECHADRIGHGTHIFDSKMVNLQTEKARRDYVEALWQYVADSRITVEVCLTSNLQTMPQLKHIKEHPISKMLEKRLSFTFCTDNRLVSQTTVTDEIDLAVANFDVKPSKLKDLIAYGFKRSFFAGDYLLKRKYVRTVIDYYERMEKEHGVVA